MTKKLVHSGPSILELFAKTKKNDKKCLFSLISSSKNGGGTDGRYPPRWWSLETGVICWSQETGVNNAANELIKCREVGGDPESLGG